MITDISDLLSLKTEYDYLLDGVISPSYSVISDYMAIDAQYKRLIKRGLDSNICFYYMEHRYERKGSKPPARIIRCFKCDISDVRKLF